MALDSSIYGRFQPRSAVSFATELEQLAGMRDQRQDNALARSFRQEQMGAAREQASRAGALRQLQQSLAGKPENEYAQGLRAAGEFDEAARFETGRLDRSAKAADVRKRDADAAKTFGEAQAGALGRYRQALELIDTREGAARWLQAQFQDPILSNFMTAKLGSLEEAVARLPTDPQQLQQWRQQAVMGMQKFQEMMMDQARDAETVRAKQASEALTRRGQDIGASTQRRGQDMADRRAGQTMEADSGGPGQMDLVRQFGRPPKDHRWKPDGSAEPIPGGPADIKAGAEGEKRTQRKQALSAAARDVLGTVKDARQLVGVTTAGVGGLLSAVPATEARNLSAKLETIKSNLGFDRLQQMRDMSPTGGALGSVAVQELVALQSTVASLDQKQSPGELRAALDKIEVHYNRWLETMDSAESKPAASSATGGPFTDAEKERRYQEWKRQQGAR